MEKKFTFNLWTDFHTYRLFKKVCRSIIVSEIVYPGMIIVTVRQQ